MQYQKYAISKICNVRIRDVFHEMMVLSPLQIKEGIKSCLPRSICAHPLEMASVSAQRLYDHTVLLNNPTHFFFIITLGDGSTTSGSLSSGSISSRSPPAKPISCYTIPTISASPPSNA